MNIHNLIQAIHPKKWRENPPPTKFALVVIAYIMICSFWLRHGGLYHYNTFNYIDLDQWVNKSVEPNTPHYDINGILMGTTCISSHNTLFPKWNATLMWPFFPVSADLWPWPRVMSIFLNCFASNLQNTPIKTSSQFTVLQCLSISPICKITKQLKSHWG